jgi:hypothetical protein
MGGSFRENQDGVKKAEQRRFSSGSTTGQHRGFLDVAGGSSASQRDRNLVALGAGDLLTSSGFPASARFQRIRGRVCGDRVAHRLTAQLVLEPEAGRRAGAQARYVR